jgi:YesN/AraC family two-component response regulator
MISTTTLIVDDEEDMRVLLRMTIEAANKGLSVAAEAANGHEALDMWREHRPDVVVLDQRMPDLSGMDVAARILAEAPHQRIILFSAFLTDDLVREAETLGLACLGKEKVRQIPELLWRLAPDA